MSPVFKFALAAALTLALQSAFAQTSGTSSMPPGTQNPALAQPRLVQPPQLVQPYQPGPQPGAPAPSAGVQPFQPGPQPGQPAPSALIGPGGAGGLCECLNSHVLSAEAFDKTHLHQSCLASADACQTSCNTQNLYSFVPHAIYTCPGRPEEGHIAMNTRRSTRLLGAR